MQDKFINVKDLTKPPWNLSQTDAYALVKAKGFPVVKMGGRYKIIVDELDGYFKKNIGKEIVPPRESY